MCPTRLIGSQCQLQHDWPQRVIIQTSKSFWSRDETALNWFPSYLHQQKQSVFIESATSSPLTLLHGLPRGSILGPVLFTLYAAPLVSILKATTLNIIYTRTPHSSRHLFTPTTTQFLCRNYGTELKTCRHRRLATGLKANGNRQIHLFLTITNCQNLLKLILIMLNL